MRTVSRLALLVAVHLGLWTVAYGLAFGLHFDVNLAPQDAREMVLCFPFLIAIRAAFYWHGGLFRGLWRYTGGRELQSILVATTASTLLFFVAQELVLEAFPRSVIAIEWALCIILVGGARFAYRTFTADRRPEFEKDARLARLLIVGAGDAGEMLLREVHRRHAGRYQVVGFVDDDQEKLLAHIHGVEVLGTVDQIPALVAHHRIDELVIAAPTASGAQMRRIVDRCNASGAGFKTIPGFDQLLDGRVTLTQFRDVAIEDLLGRAPVQVDPEGISSALRGKVVMVTGAGGSIGSELCHQICRFAPASLLLVERTENSLFQIHRQLAQKYPGTPLVPCLADVADGARLGALFWEHRPSVVFHAAAHKHVPMLEWNPSEAITNNVMGTRTLADLADHHGVERFVMVSTDKAVNPTSVMGASKRVAEIYVQCLSQRSKTRFVTVRFGNVLGSAGSVIPIFKEQIAAGGPVTVTHPEMRRYFMTIPEASQLVLQAGAMGHGGEIFILDMGEPVRIADLANDLITLSGFTPGVDMAIEFSGVRPGEKLFEELSVDEEAAEKTGHPKIFVGRFRPYERARVERGLARLTAAIGLPAEAIRSRFTELVPEYRSPAATRSLDRPAVKATRRTPVPDREAVRTRQPLGGRDGTGSAAVRGRLGLAAELPCPWGWGGPSGTGVATQ